MLLIVLIGLVFFFLFDKLDKKYLLLFLPYLIYFSFVRFGFGSDYFSYFNIYQSFNPRNFGVGDKIEFGYKLIMSPFKLFNVPYWIYLGIISTLILVLTIYWIYQSSENKIVSFLLYFSLFFIVWNTSAIRQGIVLAVGTNLLFNKKIKFSLFTNIIVILLLSTIHMSALFYLVILLLNYIKWDKRKLLYFFLLSYFISVFPFEIILQKLEFIPSIKILLNNYISEQKNLFSFSSIVRLIFFAVHYFFYEKITTKQYDKLIVNNFMFGIALYNILKFSEITAGRLTIYTFILLTLSTAIIYEYLLTVNSSKIKEYSIKFLFIFVSIMFFHKESGAYITQAGFEGDQSIFNVSTIFNKNPELFNTKQAFLSYRKDFCSLDKTSFLENVKYTQEEAYNDNQHFILVKDPISNKYGVLNDNGNWTIKPSFDKNGDIAGNILRFNKTGAIFDEFDYVDLSNYNRDQEVLEKEFYVNRINSELEMTLKQTSVEFDRELINSKIQNMVPRLNRVSAPEMILMKYSNFEHYIFKFYYYGDMYYIYFDKDMDLLSTYMHRYGNKYSENYILNLSTDCGRIFINSRGEIIWQD